MPWPLQSLSFLHVLDSSDVATCSTDDIVSNEVWVDTNREEDGILRAEEAEADKAPAAPAASAASAVGPSLSSV